MSIQFTCSGCQNTLRVSDAYAGMHAQCPKCGAETQVPDEATTVYPAGAAEVSAPDAAPAPETEPAPVATASNEFAGDAAWQVDATANTEAPTWQMQTPDGRRYGPVTRRALDQWLSEGRIAANCQLYCEGWGRWKSAVEVYPQLARSSLPTPAGARADRGSQFQYLQPHRGPLVLTLGILGLTFCQLLAVPAWIMGRADLAAMREGRMDPSGEGVTQAGHICGIIGTVIMLGIFLFYGLMMLMGFALALGAAGS